MGFLHCVEEIRAGRLPKTHNSAFPASSKGGAAVGMGERLGMVLSQRERRGNRESQEDDIWEGTLKQVT